MSQHRDGFSLVELLIVMVIMALVFSIGSGSVMTAMQRSRVVASADALVRIHDEARRRAIVAKPTQDLTDTTARDRADRLYGVAVVPPAGAVPGYVVLLRGSALADVMMVGSVPDREVLRIPLTPGVKIFTSTNVDGSALTEQATPLVWWYAWNSGSPLQSTTASIPIGIGTPKQLAEPRKTLATPYGNWYENDLVSVATPEVPASPVCSALEFRQGRIRVAVSIFPLGPAQREVIQ